MQLFKINLQKCVFCGNCSFYCPKHAITMSKEYELATANKNELELTYTIENLGEGYERNE